MRRQSQRHRTTSLPYAYRRDGLEFELDGYSINGEKPNDLNLKPGQTEIVLPPDGEREGWDTVRLIGTIRIPDTTVESVFPPDEQSEPPASLFVAIQCHQTIYRDRTVVESGPVEKERYPVEITLEREELRDRVELRPHLVRNGSIEADGPYATDENHRVASGRIYTAVVDPEENPESAWIDGEEISFSQSDHLPDGDELYYLDLRNEARPKLWLNADYPRITDVLQTDGSVGAEPRMRDVVLDQIAHPVWAQLIVRTGCAVDEDGEVEHQWQETVIEAFAREMYDGDNPTEAALALRRDVRDPEALPEVMSRIDRELQNYLDPREQLINLMEEGLQI